VRYVWTQTFSFSNFLGGGGTSICMDSKILIFLIVSGSGNLDMYGTKHLVFQLFGEWELRYEWA
jgi:hypothetical protein